MRIKLEAGEDVYTKTPEYEDVPYIKHCNDSANYVEVHFEFINKKGEVILCYNKKGEIL